MDDGAAAYDSHDHVDDDDDDDDGDIWGEGKCFLVLCGDIIHIK